MLRTKIILSLLGIMIILGCSKDEPSENLKPNPEVSVGVFIDSPVEGLYYETPSRSGFTNSAGEFEYLKGEKVSFYVGDIKLGSAMAKSVMTPITIASVKGASIYTKEVKYMAAFLQTLDLDGNPKNGIKLIPDVVNAIDQQNISFKQPQQDLMFNIVKLVKETTGIELNEVYPEQAASHLAETLGENYNSYQNLLPILKSWSNSAAAMSSFEWSTVLDEDGKIQKFIRMEKYPSRLSSEYEILSFNENGFPESYLYRSYISGEVNYSEKVDIIYDEIGQISGFDRFNINGDSYTQFGKLMFTELDSNGYVLTSKAYTPANEFQQQWVYQRLENGNKTSAMRYLTEEIVNEVNYSARNEYTYTDFGDLHTLNQFFPDRSDRFNTYFYREDNTLSQRTMEFSNNIRVYDYFYDENEVQNAFHITEGEWRSEYVEFYPNGDYKLVNTYYKDWLQEIAAFDEEGYAMVKVWDLDKSGSFKVEYRTPDWKLYKAEYYDNDGNLFKTEHYDENEVLINTEYV
ncbi:hypothetical protein NE848_08070 [Gramella jeungdoensis]|uniref:Uncharacterized protein n=1 Tax=Gramella jeungdoensis TaxID=708091 RepID=A0ABT0Z0R6_9FLAO|nr:hypothetical protein [Gramella jeungdoensis]MCM8569332.1 hypothetical protein [Gramella jeungdoensis]